MPNIGDIVRGSDLGKSSGRKYIWAECPDCLEQRWADSRPLDKGTHRRCQACVRAEVKSRWRTR